jgi:hypothetical protein
MPSIEIKTGFSNRRGEAAAVTDVWQQISQDSPQLVVMFAPCRWDQQQLNEAWQRTLPAGTPLIGGTSMRINLPFLRMIDNVAPEGFREGLTAMSLSSTGLSASVHAVSDVEDQGPENTVGALKRAAEALALDLSSDDVSRCFCLLLCDGPSGRADAVLEAMFLAAPRLQIVGGGTGGALQLISGKVAPGTVHTLSGIQRRGAALALVRSDVPFVTQMVTSYQPTEVEFEVTRGKGKALAELNGRPAAHEYARALGVRPWQLGTVRLPNSRLLLKNPLGLMVEGKPYLRGVAFRDGDGLDVVVGDLQAGQRLRLMKPGDLVGETQRAIHATQQALGKVSGALLFNCAYRTLEADIRGVRNELFSSMKLASSIGLLSYGEYFKGLAVEQTLTLVAFGAG